MSAERPLSRDTSLAAERAHLALLRAAGPARRGALAASLTSQVVAASRRAIAQRHPELTGEGVRLLWAELHYGLDLAARVRARLSAAPR